MHVLDDVPQVLPGGNQKAAGAAGGVGNRVPGVGATSSTIILMMWRGVRNCPFCPAVAILESMYSYRSPLVSRSSIGMASSMVTTAGARRGSGRQTRHPS